MDIKYTFVQVPKHDKKLSYPNIPNKKLQSELNSLTVNGGCISTSHNKFIVIEISSNINEFYIPLKVDQRSEKYITIKIELGIFKSDGKTVYNSITLNIQTGRYYDFKIKVDRTEKYPMLNENPPIIEFEITIGNSIKTRNIIDLYTENHLYPDNYQCSLGKTKLNLCTLYNRGLYTVKGNATGNTLLKFVGRQSKRTLYFMLWDRDYGLGQISTTNNWDWCWNKV